MLLKSLQQTFRIETEQRNPHSRHLLLNLIIAALKESKSTKEKKHSNSGIPHILFSILKESTTVCSLSFIFSHLLSFAPVVNVKNLPAVSHSIRKQ
jgi:hypothetical protein